MGLRILDLNGYCGTAYGRQKRTEDEVGTFLGEGSSCLPGGLMGGISLSNWLLSKFQYLSSSGSQKFSESRVTWITQIHEATHGQCTNLQWEAFLPRDHKAYVHCPKQPFPGSEWTQMLSKGTHGAEETSEGALLPHSNCKRQGPSSAQGLGMYCQVKMPSVSCSPRWPLPLLPRPSLTFTQSTPRQYSFQINWVNIFCKMTFTFWACLPLITPELLALIWVLRGPHISGSLLLYSHRWLITSIVCEFY